MLELSNFKRAPKFDCSTGQPQRETYENPKSGLPDHSDAQKSLELFCEQFVYDSRFC
jgi:hypothetical protein